MATLVLKVNSEEKVFEAETREDLDQKVNEYVESEYLTWKKKIHKEQIIK